MIISSLVNKTLTLERQTVTQDAIGGAVQAFAAAPGNPSFRGLIEPASAFTSAEYMRRNIRVTDRIYTNADLDSVVTGGVKPGDRVSDSGTYYIVKGIQPYSSSLGAVKVVVLYCERLIV